MNSFWHVCCTWEMTPFNPGKAHVVTRSLTKSVTISADTSKAQHQTKGHAQIGSMDDYCNTLTIQFYTQLQLHVFSPPLNQEIAVEWGNRCWTQERSKPKQWPQSLPMEVHPSWGLIIGWCLGWLMHPSLAFSCWRAFLTQTDKNMPSFNQSMTCGLHWNKGIGASFAALQNLLLWWDSPASMLPYWSFRAHILHWVISLTEHVIQTQAGHDIRQHLCCKVALMDGRCCMKWLDVAALDIHVCYMY